MSFREDLGVVTCRCAIEQSKPILFVSHAGGDWQMYCDDKNHDFDDVLAIKRDLVLVNVSHLLATDPSLNVIADLPIDMAAERETVGSCWTQFSNSDDD
jgi:hypothetical protein